MIGLHTKPRKGSWGLGMGLAAMLVLLVSGCAKREANTLVVYAAGPRSLAEWMCAEFQKETGCATKLYSATTGEIMAKLQAEEFRPQADVVILASPTAAEVLKDERMLAPLPPGLPTRPEWTDKDGTYAGTAASALGIALRRDRANPALEWTAIFEGRFSGTMIMPSPSQSGTSAEFVIAFDIAEGEKFWNGLKAAKRHGLQISGPNSQALTGLVLRSHEAVLAAADYLVFKQIQNGEPLVLQFPASGCPVIPRPVCILKGSQNLSAANNFVRFCFSPKVQQRIAAEHLLPADASVPLSAQRLAAGPVKPMLYDVNLAKSRQHEALRRFQYEIEKGVE